MAPRKRKAEGVEETAAKPLAETTTKSTRVTRSTTRRVNSNSADSAAELAKAAKNQKAKPTPKPKPSGKKKEEVKDEDVVEPGKEEADGVDSNEKTVVIEHCKQCSSFKIRANQVKDGLEKGLPGIQVLLNPEKPRRGCFEIREKGGVKFISLLEMKRPFKPMKDLNMDEVVSDIVAKLK